MRRAWKQRVRGSHGLNTCSGAATGKQRAHAEQAAVQFAASALSAELEQTRAFIASLP